MNLAMGNGNVIVGLGVIFRGIDFQKGDPTPVLALRAGCGDTCPPRLL